MNGMEALTRLIYLSDIEIARKKDEIFDDRTAIDMEIQQDELAIAIATAILNNGLPIARFRLHVTVDEDQVTPKKLKTKNMKVEDILPVREEFTVCGVSIQAVRQGIMALSAIKANVQVTLWEQRATGADMVSGFQGSTKTIQYRSWLKEIMKYNAPQQKTEIPQAPTVQ